MVCGCANVVESGMNGKGSTGDVFIGGFLHGFDDWIGSVDRFGWNWMWFVFECFDGFAIGFVGECAKVFDWVVAGWIVGCDEK